MRNQKVDEELVRRLDILEDPDYEDSARKDLPALDLIILTSVIIATVVLLYWWGY